MVLEHLLALALAWAGAGISYWMSNVIYTMLRVELELILTVFE